MAKATEYSRITKLKDGDIFLVDGPDGTRTIAQSDAAKELGKQVVSVTHDEETTVAAIDPSTGDRIELATAEETRILKDAMNHVENNENVEYISTINAGINTSNGSITGNSSLTSIIVPCAPSASYRITKLAGRMFRIGDVSSYPITGTTVCNPGYISTASGGINNDSEVVFNTSESAVYLVITVHYAHETRGDTISREDMLASVRVVRLTARDQVARDSMLADNFKPRLVDFLRNVAFIGIEGSRVMSGVVSALGFDEWVDIAKDLIVDSNGEVKHGSYEGNPNAVTRLIDIGTCTSIQSKFEDNASPELHYVVCCYRANGTYIGRTEENNGNTTASTVIRVLPEGTRFIRLFTPSSQVYHVTNAAENYSGRTVDIWLNNADGSAIVHKKIVFTKTEDVSNVM